MGVAGVVVLLGIALLLSRDRRRALSPRIFAWGLGLQLAIGLFALRTSAGARLFAWSNDAANHFIGFANAGIRFVFGDWPAVAIVQAPGLGPEQGALRSRCCPSSCSSPA